MMAMIIALVAVTLNLIQGGAVLGWVGGVITEGFSGVN
jgi:hypothetical protein